MLENLPLVNMASAMARHAVARHRIIAENVANADTPGYRARDIKDFTAMVNESFTARTSRPGHRSDGGDGAMEGLAALRPFELELPIAPNGNSVSVEDQALRAVEAQNEHRLAVTLYGQTVKILRLGIGRLN